MNRARLVRTLAAVAMATALLPAAAQKYPEKTVNYYLPFVAGGESDIAARFQQELFRRKFGQEMVIQYKPGAGGGLAWAQLNSMPADGYTVMGINLPHIVLQPMEGNVQYKTEDLQSVYWFHYTPDAIVVAQDSPYQSFADFVKVAKEKPNELTLAGSGTNSANHAAHEKFNQLAGVKTTYVPFKGTGELTTSVIGKHVSGAMSYLTFAIQQKGKVRALAVATEKRHPLLPDVPTFKELGFDWVDGAYRGIAVPKSTPPAVQKQVSDMMAALNQDPEMRRKMIDGGYEPVDIPVEKIPAFLAEHAKDYTVSAKRLGLVK
jgi:tripartite-type tricarboxylate transporter receptor subunit TctC